MVVSQKMYTPLEYLKLVTGKNHILSGRDDVKSIRKILKDEGCGVLWCYPLDDIECIVHHSADVVLVDCLVWNHKTEQMEHKYCWFEVEV